MLKEPYVSTCCLRAKQGSFVADVMDAVTAYVKQGIRGIELGSAHRPFSDFKLLAGLRKEHGLDYIFHANFPSIGGDRLVNIASCDEKFRQASIRHYLSAIDKLNSVEGSLLSMHSGSSSDVLLANGRIVNKSDWRAARLRTVPALQEILDHAKRYGIRIAVENSSGMHDGSFVVRPCDFNGLQKDVGRGLGLLLDIGHLDTYLNQRGNRIEGDRRDEIQKVERHILEMHCHRGISNDEHLPPTKELFADFKKSTLRKAALTLEVNNADMASIMDGYRLLWKMKKQ